MKYVCGACAKEVTADEIKKRIRCPYCGNKVLFKKRPNITKKVKAR
jgi:DNA-directed RNA polymerase subunit P